MSSAPRSLLVVDDHKDNRIIFRVVLEHAGYGVLLATNGREAVEIATLSPPDLILMDLWMPVMDGWQSAAILKAHPSTAPVPILAVSASDYSHDTAGLRSAGFCGFLHKPVYPNQLLAAVTQCLAATAGGTAWTEFPRDVATPRM